MPTAVRSRFVTLSAALALLAGALPARAQLDADQPAAPAPKPKPGKKPAKPTKKAPKEEAPATPATPAEDATPKPAADETKAADESKPAEEGKEGEEKKTVAEQTAAESGSELTNTREDPNQRYYFIGLRYRGTIIPKFIENLFVDEGATIYSNTIGVEFDMRKGGQSMIPWITYTDYSMGDTLFHQKGATMVNAADAPNFTVVNSSLKAIYLGLDELWSVPLDKDHKLDFEFGFGVGIGFLFGNLENQWVFQNDNGPFHSTTTGMNYSICQPLMVGTGNSGPQGCNISDHSGATPPGKPAGHVEPNWFNGGSVPVIFPHIAFPQLDLRYKPIKPLEARLSLGFSLTGFWFGLSADYGLEDTSKKPPKASTRNLTRLRDML